MSDSPLGVALGLGGLDLCLSLGVLLLSCGGERRWLGRTADSLVGSLDTASDDFFSGADDGVELRISLNQVAALTGRWEGRRRFNGTGWQRVKKYGNGKEWGGRG